MKAGDYVRTEMNKIGIQLISKIKEICDGDLIFTTNGYWDKENIIKSSPNIIDLIEVGDYVNGRIVDDCIYLDKLGLIGLSELEKEDEKFIKSIVTKEQFSSMEYKINE